MNSRLSRPLFAAIVALLAAGACKPGNDNNTGGGSSDGAGGSGANGGGTTTDGGSGDGGNPTTSQFMNGPGGGPPTGCDSTPDEDADMDGYTGAMGDCNDCDPNSNPSAIEVIGEAPDGEEYVPVDEDCDEIADNVAAPCDAGLQLASTAAMDAAQAIELCKVASGPTDWGVVSANFVRSNGAARTSSFQNGIMASFGTNVTPRGGDNLFVLSSGRARIPGQPDACGSASCYATGSFPGLQGTPQSGYPQNAPGCNINNQIFDDVGLELELRAPSNATGYSFDFKFYTFEYAEWVCTKFNDQFMAFVQPAPQGANNGNISFDANGAPVSVNIAFFTVCEGCQNWAEWCEDPTLGSPNCPPAPSGANCCIDGAGDLQGNGFDVWSDGGINDDGNAGGTAWLQTRAPIGGLETFKIRFAIWDTGDASLDATSVIDNFKWIANGGEVDVGTDPAPPQ